MFVQDHCLTLVRYLVQVLSMRGQLGTLEVGAVADLVVLNDDLQVLKTFINGKLAHTA